MPHSPLPFGLDALCKRCPECGEVKSLEAFPRNKRSKDGRAFYCKPCHNRKGRESRERHHGSSRSYHLNARYGITGAEAERMLDEQGGVCAICLERRADHVDHDHSTGRVRKLLCFNCNGGLGQFHDDPSLLRAAADYLSRHDPADDEITQAIRGRLRALPRPAWKQTA